MKIKMKRNCINISVLLIFLCCFSAQLWGTTPNGIGKGKDEFIANGITYRKIENSNEVYVIETNGVKVIPSTIYSYSVVGIGGSEEDAFNLTSDSIFLPNSIRWISGNAFRKTRLKYINIPDSIIRIGAYAFYGTKISSVFIPRKLTDIESRTFAGTNVDSFQVDRANPAYTSEDGILYNKSKTILISYPPGRETDLFRIPDGVMYILTGAFQDAKIDSLVIPDNVKYINECDFRVLNFTNIIPDGITRIHSGAFKGCTNLTSVTIPNNVTSIGSYAFANCTNLTSVVIPESVTSIERSAFSCSGLTSVTIPNSVKTIGIQAFAECYNLRSIYIPESVTSVGFAVFRDCHSLDTIQISDNSPIFEFSGFGSTKWYRSQKDGMVYIGKVLCAYKDKGVYVERDAKTLDEQRRKYGYSLDNDRMLQRTKIIIPDGIHSISSNVFRNCIGLTKITLPESIEYIGNMVFAGCFNLRSIHIPQKVKTINEGSFCHSGLRKIHVYWQDPSFVNILYFGKYRHVFAPKKCKLIVPKGTKKKYQQLDAWKDFKIVERKR